jgi:ketosteroid isomerase-like protein
MDGPLDLTRRLLANLGSGAPDAASVLLAPDIEWYGSVGGLEPGLARGREAVLRSFEDYSGTWTGLHFESRSVVVDGDRVLALMVEHARGMESGVEVDQGIAILLTTKDGMITNIVTYLDVPQAYVDFGIEPADVARLEAGRAYELRDGRPVEIEA